MKLWLDDERPAPEGWHRVKTADEALKVLATAGHLLEEISLDHDLGDLTHSPERTGYTVLEEIERLTACQEEYFPPRIYIHTANPVARRKMQQAVESIERLVDNKRRMRDENSDLADPS